MRLFNILGVLLTMLLVPSCLLPPPEPVVEPWTSLTLSNGEEFTAETPIRSTHASPTELLMVADTEFLRYGTNNEIKERRRLQLPLRLFGRPVISNDVFVRMIRNTNQAREIEFHLVKNKDEIFRFPESDLITTSDADIVLQPNSYNTAAFNETGDKFILPTIRIPGNHYTFFILDIQLDATKSSFENISIQHRVDIPEFPADPENLVNIRYVNGNYYITSLDGAYRITPQGDYWKITPEWKLDVFEKDNILYMTGFEDFDFRFSNDNGLTWTLSDFPSKAQFVSRAKNLFFTQRALGVPFQVLDDNLLTEVENQWEIGKDFTLNEDITRDPAAHTNVTYLNGSYYLTVLKKVYHSCRIIIEEEE